MVATRTKSVRANLDRHGVQLVRGQARLAPGPSVIVRDDRRWERRLQAGVILIATGSRPLHPPGFPFEDPDVHDLETILGLDRIPRTMVVVVGGPVGCEYASLFTALGVEVTLLDLADRLLPFMDVEISGVVAAAFADMGSGWYSGRGRRPSSGSMERCRSAWPAGRASILRGWGWFQHSPRAQIAAATHGLSKLVFRRDDHRLLEVHIVGEVAGELDGSGSQRG